MVTSIADIAALREHRAAGRDLAGVVLVGLDLTVAEDDLLLRTRLDGALMLGCQLTPPSRARADAAGAMLFPDIPGLPYRVYRSSLYSPAELFDRFNPEQPASYADTLDARVYRYVQECGAHPEPLPALAQRLHDHSITEALDDVLAVSPHPVAVMGGHDLPRDSSGYAHAVALGQALGASATGYTVLTGGGPGAMEAVPLGVRLTGVDPGEALRILSSAPRFSNGSSTVDHEAIGSWLAAGLNLDLPTFPVPRTIGIPTWFYGHEPS